jgi:ectoine hydroxylase-related dioxygenase (phytanoyl-CoA dioxygenase family)
MNKISVKQEFHDAGYVSAIDIIDHDTAAQHRQSMESTEAKIGPLHYKSKIHILLRSPFELATHNNALNVVEQIIGPDILLYNTTYIVKEPGTSSYVSWHQDLTYWGFDCDDQVSMWLALSPANKDSGCMRMIPGSHKSGKQAHVLSEDNDNVLFSGQTIPGVEERASVYCPLQPGQASFHHGWTLHASMPNQSDDRRIGLNVQYIAPHVRQTKHDGDTAILVRGQDRYHHFGIDAPPKCDLAPEAVAMHQILDDRYRQIASAK